MFRHKDSTLITPYTVGAGTFDGGANLSSGSFVIESDNYPTDPTLLRYAGSFDLLFKKDDLEYNVIGQYSFEERKK